ncbi:MAG TPA: glycosyltransferase family 2 protein [Stellaceae bacterium]|nr:glycosyltransferase family 2 protein [Stellaceae bacterium]
MLDVNPFDPGATGRQPARDAPMHVSIVVPVYNEAGVIIEFNRRLAAVRNRLAVTSDVVFVDDGSRDQSPALLRGLHESDRTISVITLSRNFGKEIAMTAGLDYSRGDAVILIDADLQDPPELIPTLIEQWSSAGADVVYAQRRSRAGETWLKKALAYGFYRVANLLARPPVPVDTGDFRLLSRRAVAALRQLREHHRFMKGLFSWIGYRQIAVTYERDPRFSGKSKWNYWKLWNFSLDGVTSFSIAPLRMASYIGFLTAGFALVYGFFILVRTLLFGNPVAGYPSLLTLILFLGGVQLICLGIIGEYLGRVFNETKRRPLYLVDSVLSATPDKLTAATLDVRTEA